MAETLRGSVPLLWVGVGVGGSSSRYEGVRPTPPDPPVSKSNGSLDVVATLVVDACSSDNDDHGLCGDLGNGVWEWCFPDEDQLATPVSVAPRTADKESRIGIVVSSHSGNRKHPLMDDLYPRGLDPDGRVS